jgi:hypothetical protein
MCRLWYVFVFVATMFGLPGSVWPRGSSSTHPIRSGGSAFIPVLQCDDRLPSSMRVGLRGTTFQVAL